MKRDPTMRDERGRFVPGHPPSGRGVTSAEHDARLRSLLEAIPPERVGGMLRDVLDLARKQKSPRTMIAALSLWMRYVVGRPAQLGGTGSEGVDLLIAMLQQGPGSGS